LAEEYDRERLIIVLGLNEPDNLQIIATTFMEGDPSFAGPLAGIALGLKSYHILELKDHITPQVWDKQMAMEELEIEEDTLARIRQTMSLIRGD